MEIGGHQQNGYDPPARYSFLQENALSMKSHLRIVTVPSFHPTNRTIVEIQNLEKGDLPEALYALQSTSQDRILVASRYSFLRLLQLKLKTEFQVPISLLED